MSDIDLLRGNFQEIYQVANISSTTSTSPKSTSHYLVPNYQGTRLYHSTCLMGLVWRSIFWISSFLLKENFHETKFHAAILHTKQVFENQLQIVTQAAADYIKYVEQSSLGEPVDEAQIHLLRKIISAWNETTKPFLKFLAKQPQILKTIHCELLNEFSKATPTATKTANLQQIINLECVVGAPIPFNTLRKRLHRLELTEDENRTLNNWIHQVNQVQNLVLELYQGLYTIVHHSVRECDNRVKIELTARLAASLINENQKNSDSIKCQAFTQQDPKVMKWRQTLKPGTILPGSQQPITLGREIDKEANDSGKIRLFEVASQENLLAYIAYNKAIFPLKKYGNREHQFDGIEPLQFKEIICDGSVAIAEKPTSIIDYQWSRNYWKDPLAIKAIALTKDAIAQNQTLNNLSASTVMLQNGTLVALQPMVKGPFNFNQLEIFLADCAGSSLEIFKYLMQESGLNQHRTANAYRDFFNDALIRDLERVKTPEATMTVFQIEDRSIWDRASEIYRDMQRMSAEIKTTTGASQELINRTIYKFYQESGTFSIFLYNEIERAVLDDLGMTTRL